jgi:hypothetical protein
MARARHPSMTQPTHQGKEHQELQLYGQMTQATKLAGFRYGRGRSLGGSGGMASGEGSSAHPFTVEMPLRAYSEGL